MFYNFLYFSTLKNQSLIGVFQVGRGGRVVEGARLESVYPPKADRGFESLSLRQFQTQQKPELSINHFV